MGNDLKCACRFSMGKNNMLCLALRAVVVDCICLCFCRIGAFKPAESLSAEMGIMIDWAVIKIVLGAPVRNSFVSCNLRKCCKKNVHIAHKSSLQATFWHLLGVNVTSLFNYGHKSDSLNKKQTNKQTLFNLIKKFLILWFNECLNVIPGL